MGSSSEMVSSTDVVIETQAGVILLPDHEAGAGADQTQEPAPVLQQKPLADQTEPLKCRRCESTNTKFCYFNNYNKSQPRHYCKTCKRHWTEGGTLRNVPVGGSRKNKRVKTAAAATPASPTAAVTSIFDSDIFADSNSSVDSMLSLPDLPHQDIDDLLLPFPVSSLSDSMAWQSGIGRATAGAGFWSWEDIESLVSANYQGEAPGWGNSKA
ncbi:hypothetical protein SAY86_030188 [Trapa natans]|uniref:Dof zinc finger protein n=1 Tax=Trapa natans TaxID=22666 RepID=A0AAN7M4N3_TRANT|nr:hypothetical protein SAY86_030188 [Trapa natans]